MRFRDFRGLPRNRTRLALLATALYAFLVLFALHAPIDAKSPFVILFGSQDMARQVARSFVQGLFWPFVAILAITVVQALVEYDRKKRA